MKSFKMKALAVATLGLGGLVMAGSAFAACPTDPAQPNGPWASKSTTAATLSVCPGGANCSGVTAGLNTTSCALVVGTSIGASAIAKSFVTDTTPSDESRYRARFYFDVSQLVSQGFTSGLKQVKIFDSASTTSPAGTPNTEVGVFLAGGSPPSIKINVANSDSGSSFSTISVPLTGGSTGTSNIKRFEFDLQQGASSGANCSAATPVGGCFRYWLSDAGTATTNTSPLGLQAVTNTGWSGVTQTSMGILTANPSYRSTNGALLVFDEFDSRRQTFIGQ